MLNYGRPARAPVKAAVLLFAALMLAPAHALGQTSDQIIVQRGDGAYARGESAFVFGGVARPDGGLRLAVQVVNPSGDLCNVQQTAPLSDGSFVTEPVRLSGPVCGELGTYQVLLFYGDSRGSASFEVTGAEPAQTGLSPADLVDGKIAAIQEAGMDVSQLRQRSGSLQEKYVDLWDRYNVPDAMLGVSVQLRPAVQAALDESARLLESGDIGYDLSKKADRTVYAAIFKYETGERAEGLRLVSDAFEALSSAGTSGQARQPTFEELEGTLVNLMLKNDTILSGPVKESLAFVVARGTAPLIAGEMGQLVDMLSKSRYLDVVSRNSSQLYSLVSTEWGAMRLDVAELSTIGALLDAKPGVDRLHDAAILLRDLDGVERFLSEDGGVQAIVRPAWESLSERMGDAISTEDILEMREEITRMKDVVDISYRISRTVQIAASTGFDQGYAPGWNTMLQRASDASSLEEIAGIISEFDRSIAELRENRSPLSHLRLEYERLKQQAEMRGDYENLVDIDRALRIIKSAENTGHGTSQLAHVEVLLSWASQKAPLIREALAGTSADEAQRERAADVLQRIQSLDNLVQLSLVKSRFLPGFVDFTESVSDRISQARQEVISGDLASADDQIRDLFAEWRTVTAAYERDPDERHSLDDLKRGRYAGLLDDYRQAVANFGNSDFAEHRGGYDELDAEVRRMIEYGNFVDAERQLNAIGGYLAENLSLKNDRVFFEIYYENDAWTLSGAVDKGYNEREKITVTIYDKDGGKEGELEMFDTRQGTFFTRWEEPVEPGLYIVMLQYRDRLASNIVHVERDADHEPDEGELGVQDLSREFAELERFMREYGGERASNPRIVEAAKDVRGGLAERDRGAAAVGMEDLRALIERYLPVRHRDAVVEASYDSGTVEISGAVRKSLAFSEDMFVDVLDQRGELVATAAIKDDAAGMFSASVVRSLEPGMHVAVLEYHDITVTDFFPVR